MGSTESCEGRRVSFGMDEEERVRVLQGIRLSENVVKRMKDPCQPAEGLQPGPAPCTCAPAHDGSRAPPTDSRPPRFESSGGQQPSGVKEDLARFRQEQASLQEELFQVVRREREAAAQHLQAPPPQEEPGPEKQKPAQLAKELESREAELRRRDAFYKEQLGRVEKKKAEMYALASQQFHEAAAKAESAITPRRVEPVCPGLQAQILRCYRDHLEEVLRCSELVRAYQLCVGAARKG